MGNYFLKVKFEDGTDKIIQISQNELWNVLSFDIHNYCIDNFIDDDFEVTNVWFDENSDKEIDLDDFFQHYRVNTNAIEHKFSEHENEDVFLETVKEGTYEYFLCNLTNNENKVFVDFDQDYEFNSNNLYGFE